jgi:acetyltransferase-like isoleucine patch superfamily enzyme
MGLPIKTIIKKCLYKLTYEDKIARWRRLGATIGEGVFIGFDSAIDEGFAPLLTIEDGVTIAAKTLIILHDSAMNNVCGLPIKVGRVTIRKEAFIGVNSTILCGVTVGQRAIIGAGSLVVSNIPDETIAYGNPATIRSTLTEYQERYIKAVNKPGEIKYMDIIPWRNRKLSMTSCEIAASYAKLMKQFGI